MNSINLTNKQKQKRKTNNRITLKNPFLLIADIIDNDNGKKR